MSITEEKKNETEMIQVGAEARLSPYYLHPSDGPGNSITTVQLKGENYEEWAKHVRNALRTKRKLGFIDGTLKKPTSPEDIEQWEVVNAMIVAWIMNTIEPTTRTTISMVEDASILWEDLKLQFSAGNGVRVHELKADIACCKQTGDTVAVYYGRLKKMWDELAIYKPIRTCKCGGIAALLQQDQEEDRTHEFLMGLDSVRFGTVRSTITSIEPLPKLSQVYQRIVREERQQAIARSRDERPEAVGFSVQANNKSRNNMSFQRETETLLCSHCGKTGHEVTDCYQLKGYPDWWGERGRGSTRGGMRGRGRGGGAVGSYGRGRGSSQRANAAAIVTSNAAQVVPASTGMTAHAARREGEYDRGSLPQLNDEQWKTLMTLLNTPRTDQSEKLNGNPESIEFIIDTGASHHMTWNLEYLTNIVDIVPCSIGLPDGDHTMAIKQGDICLGGDMWLRGVQRVCGIVDWVILLIVFYLFYRILLV